MRNQRLSRRTFIRSMSATIALPYLEAMTPLSAASTVAHGGIPKRLAFLSIPFGVTEETWFPKTGPGALELSEGLMPLLRHREKVSVISNLTNKFLPNTVHSGNTTFLTCANLRRDPKIRFLNSVSVDQVAAQHLGESTRFSSLELSARKEGGMGPGLSLSWDHTGKPMPAHTSPIEIFNALFGSAGQSVEQLKANLNQKRSILDILTDDISMLKRYVSKSDTERIEEYTTTVRQIEQKLEKEEHWAAQPKPTAPFDMPSQPLGGSEEVKIYLDLMVAALQTDSTRVISYRQPLNALIRELGSSLGTHQVSHYKGFDTRTDVSKKKDILQSELLAYFIDRLETTKEIDGSSLLDHTLVAYGTGIRAVHTQKDVPIVVAGGRAMGIKQGQHLVYESGETPLANLWLTMLKAADVPANGFADSTDTLDAMMV
ncbi:MAG: DUF1552 domain-containing protein [Opitutales bacterium]